MEQCIRQFLFRELEDGKDHRVDLVERISAEFLVDLSEVEDLMDRIEIFLAEVFPRYVMDHNGAFEADLVNHFWRSINWIFGLKRISYREFFVRCQSDPALEVWIRVVRSTARMVINEYRVGVKKLL